MNALLDFIPLKGNRTYIIGLAVALVVFGVQFGYVDAETGNTILGYLGAGGLLTLRAAIK